MTVRHCCSVVAHQLLIYKGIASSEMVRRQILSACGGPPGLRKFHRGRSQGNRPGRRHRKRPAIERQREGTQLYRGEFEGGVRSRPEAHSHRFPPDVIRHAVWLYLRFTLRYRDVDLLAERGLTVSNESIRRWVLKFGPIMARNLLKFTRE
jgi:hypothetical protein